MSAQQPPKVYYPYSFDAKEKLKSYPYAEFQWFAVIVAGPMNYPIYSEKPCFLIQEGFFTMQEALKWEKERSEDGRGCSLLLLPARHLLVFSYNGSHWADPPYQKEKLKEFHLLREQRQKQDLQRSQQLSQIDSGQDPIKDPVIKDLNDQSPDPIKDPIKDLNDQSPDQGKDQDKDPVTDQVQDHKDHKDQGTDHDQDPVTDQMQDLKDQVDKKNGEKKELSVLAHRIPDSLKYSDATCCLMQIISADSSSKTEPFILLVGAAHTPEEIQKLGNFLTENPYCYSGLRLSDLVVVKFNRWYTPDYSIQQTGEKHWTLTDYAQDTAYQKILLE